MMNSMSNLILVKKRHIPQRVFQSERIAIV